MTLRTLIVDDEQLARRGLELRLAQYDDVEVVGFAGDGRQAVAAIQSLKPDVVFLDIQMPEMNGFDVVAALPPELAPAIVFVTAYDQYAVQAFRANALDYVLKPIDEERLAECLRRVRQSLQQRQALEQRSELIELLCELTGDSPLEIEEAIATGEAAGHERYLTRLAVKEGRRVIRLDVKKIDWIDAAGDYMCVHADGRTHVLRGTMKRLEAALNPLWFQRIHRSTIVNIHRVRELRPHLNGEYFLLLPDGVELKLSRNYKDKLKYFLHDT